MALTAMGANANRVELPPHPLGLSRCRCLPKGPLKSGMAVAIELLELALLMRAERHRREHPEATEEEVAAVVQAWKVDRPGAPHGDSNGRPVPWPRR